MRASSAFIRDYYDFFNSNCSSIYYKKKVCNCIYYTICEYRAQLYMKALYKKLKRFSESI